MSRSCSAVSWFPALPARGGCLPAAVMVRRSLGPQPGGKTPLAPFRTSQFPSRDGNPRTARYDVPRAARRPSATAGKQPRPRRQPAGRTSRERHLHPPRRRCPAMTERLLPVQFRLAGALLRHHREAARQTVEAAAAELGCDPSKISRIETGHRKPVPAQVQQLLAAYGVADRERQAITVLTQAARAGWWGEYRGLLPDALVDRAMLESIADDVMSWEPQALPP